MKNPLASLKPTGQTWLGIAIALIVFAAAFRVLRVVWLPDLPNFSPLMAIAFCGAWFLPGALALIIPMVALIASDLVLNAYYGVAAIGLDTGIRYALYLGAALLGLWLSRRSASPLTFFSGVLGSGVAFYLVTNTTAWLGNPLYAQSLAGWAQAITVGLPGYPPTWMFFRNSLASDLLFSGMMLAAAWLATRPQAVAAPALR